MCPTQIRIRPRGQLRMFMPVLYVTQQRFLAHLGLEPLCICYVFLFFDLLYHRGYQRQYFWWLNKKKFGLWCSYGLKQGNPLQWFKKLTKYYSICLLIWLVNVPLRVSKVRNFGDESKNVNLWGRFSCINIYTNVPCYFKLISPNGSPR